MTESARDTDEPSSAEARRRAGTAPRIGGAQRSANGSPIAAYKKFSGELAAPKDVRCGRSESGSSLFATVVPELPDLWELGAIWQKIAKKAAYFYLL
jgi:hypothetical protein